MKQLNETSINHDKIMSSRVKTNGVGKVTQAGENKSAKDD